MSEPKGDVPKDKLWDQAEEEEQGDIGQYSDQFFQVIILATKIVTCVVTAAVVILSATLSNGILLFMTSQIAPNKQTPICYVNSQSNIYNYKAVSNAQEQAQWMWALFLTFAVPETLVFLDSTRILLFQKFKIPRIQDFFLVATCETLHTIGMCLLMFVTLPELDVIRGVMLFTCVSFVPGILKMCSRPKFKSTRLTVDVLAVLCQLSGFLVWPLTVPTSHAAWSIPLSLVLISVGWWSNYVGKGSRLKMFVWLNRAKNSLDKERGRHFIYCFVSVWKIGVFFVSMIGFVYVTTPSGQQIPFLTYNVNTTSFRYLNVTQSAKSDNYTVVQPSTVVGTVQVKSSAPMVTWALQFSCAFFCHFAAKFACRIRAQRFSFSLPLSMVIPVTLSILLTLCSVKSENVCSMSRLMPSYLYWQCPSDKLTTSSLLALSVVWVAWFFSQIWISIHIWSPVNEHLLTTDKLFSLPLYSGVMVDQSHILSRRVDNKKEIIRTVSMPTIQTTSTAHITENINVRTSLYDDEEDNEDEYDRKKHDVTRVFACATMWHENFEEMVGLFISILRIDKDRFIARYKRSNFKYINKDYFVYETHIFFDDAFKFVDPENGNKNIMVNGFVTTMIAALEEAIKKFHLKVFKVGTPKKMVTPYGGRLTFLLPGKTKLFVHLKDKNKIRHRKRWSQVMYMYYLLGYRLWASRHSDRAKDVRAKHSFILALDGDIDFKPEAVRQVVTLMIKDPRIGAACGRIHPVGSGMMTWYQKFEYALGHWLQKATEHVTGCVLCSPGCFSLFRAEALMKPNVMKTYTRTAKEAYQYVQYDQGEDRWLCTLLLKQGFKVVYMAASHAYTHCPISFQEFYNQRRRWVPSTMANIVDLLNDRALVVNNNESVSNLYIIYQWMMMIGTVMGPGSIFLMLVSSLNVAFGVSNVDAMWINAIPLLVFILACAFASQTIQLIIAEILTAGYALMMIGVLVAIVIQMVEEGVLSPSTFFTVALMGIFVLSACLHPREFNCLLYFLIYWLVIPSMYLLLIIYSLMNMHDVTWGTREVAEGKTPEQIEEERVELEKLKKKKEESSLLKMFSREQNSNGSFGIDCAGLCSIKCCTNPAMDMAVMQSNIMAINTTLKELVNENQRKRRLGVDNTSMASTSKAQEPSQLKQPAAEIDNQKWFRDLIGDDVKMSKNQATFWDDIISAYLKPLDENIAEKAIVTDKLIALRNHMAYSFFMINLMFTFTMFLMQQHKDVLSITWPIAVNSTISYRKENQATVVIDTTYMQMEPIGTFLVVFFGVILLIQTLGMFIHRWGTFTKVMAATKLHICSFCVPYALREDRKQKTKKTRQKGDANATQLIQNIVRELRGSFINTYVTNNKIPRPKFRQPKDLEQLVNVEMSRIERQESVIDLRMPQNTVEELIERRISVITVNQHPQDTNSFSMREIGPHVTRINIAMPPVPKTPVVDYE